MIFAHFQTKRDFLGGGGVKTLYCGGGGTGHTGALAPPVYMLKKGSGLVFRTICTVFCIKIEA